MVAGMKARASARRTSRRSATAARRQNRLSVRSRRNRITASRRGWSAVNRRSAEQRPAGPRRSTRTRRTRVSAETTNDHDEIREWAESRGGRPSVVRQTGLTRRGGGVLRIDFPGFSGRETLKQIPWEEWFEIFEQSKLSFLHDTSSRGRFNKFVRRSGNRR
jgi:hypothetical protein